MRRFEKIVQTNRIFNDPVLNDEKNCLKDGSVSLCSLLGYDLDKSFIKYYFNNESNNIGFKWKELKSNRTHIINSHYKKNSKDLLYSYTDKKDIIVKHIFSKDYSKYVYKKSNVKKIIDNYVKFNPNKKEIEKYKDNSIIESAHVIGNTIHGGFVKEYSDILVLDIDNHDDLDQNLFSQQIFNFLPDELLNNIIHIEESFEKSYHIFVKLDKEYSLVEKRMFIAPINEHIKSYKSIKSKIEVPEKIAFPLSYRYSPVEYINEQIKPVTTYMKLYLFETIHKYNDIKGYCLNQSKIVVNATEEVIIENKIQWRPSELYFRSKTKFISKDEKIKQLKSNPDFKIYSGDRWNTIHKIMREAKSYDINNDELFEIIQSNNIDSKDLSDSHKLTKLKKECFGSYSKTNYRNIIQEPNKFFSNRYIIPEDILNKLHKNKFIDSVIENCGRELNDKNREIFKIVLTEMIGKFYYNIEKPKNVKNSFSNKYLIGIQFSKSECNLLKQQHGILKNTDVYNLLTTLYKSSGLFKQHFSCKRGWFFNPVDTSKNRCRQFDLLLNDKSIIKDKLILSSIITTLCSRISNKIKKYKKRLSSSHAIFVNKMIKQITIFRLVCMKAHKKRVKYSLIMNTT